MNCLTKHCFLHTYTSYTSPLWHFKQKELLYFYATLCYDKWICCRTFSLFVTVLHLLLYIFFRVKNIFWQILTSSSIITEPDFTSVIHEWNLSMTYLTHSNTSYFTVTNRTFFALRIYPNWIHLKVEKEHKHTQDAMLTLNIYRCLSIFTGLPIILKNPVFR